MSLFGVRIERRDESTESDLGTDRFSEDQNFNQQNVKDREHQNNQIRRKPIVDQPRHGFGKNHFISLKTFL